MEKVPMTSEGYRKLEAELHRLKAEERPRIIQQISEARAHGDLSENAEYHAAKDAQGLNEARVADLEDKIARAEIIDPSKLSGSTVKFGATVAIGRRRVRRQGEIQDRRRRRGQSAGRQDLDQFAHSAGADWQVKGRKRRGHDTKGRAQLRDPEGRVQIAARIGESQTQRLLRAHFSKSHHRCIWRWRLAPAVPFGLHARH